MTADKDLMSKIESAKQTVCGRILCGSCVDILRGIEPDSVQTVISDPPWGIDYGARREKFSDIKIENDSLEKYKKMMNLFMPELCRVLKKSGSIYIFSGGGVLKPIVINGDKILHWNTYYTIDLFFKYGFNAQILFWDKVAPGLSYRYRGSYEFILFMTRMDQKSKWRGMGEFRYDHIQLEEGNLTEIFRYTRIAGVNKTHTAEKPVRLYESFMLDTTDSGDVVMDPFAGSGPVVEACKNCDRSYLAIELLEENVELIKNRERQVSLNEAIRAKKSHGVAPSRETKQDQNQLDITMVHDLRSQREEEEILAEMEMERNQTLDLFSPMEDSDESLDQD